MAKVETILLSSLEKVFADERPQAAPCQKGTALRNEAFSFQLAYRGKGQIIRPIEVSVESPLADHIRVYNVGLIPVEYPLTPDHDDNVLRTTPGLYPDLLEPIEEVPPMARVAFPHQWRALWIAVHNPEGLEPGTYPIYITLKNRDGEILSEDVFELEILAAQLPPQKLIHTEWLHTDCIATWYGLEIFSEDYWQMVEKYVQTAVDFGVNMILTPIFTPPLDTDIGGERPTVQLVEVTKEGDQYSFDFTKLDRWIAMCRRCGVEYFEFSHLFTQWGAYHAPKIMAWENGELKRIFGWDTNARSPEYTGFLDQFLPALVEFIKEHGIADKCYFHVSDEPSIWDLESYGAASAAVKKHLSDFPVIDSLSNFEFYETGLVEHPIPASDHIEPFLENNVPDLWTYYCSAQHRDVAQRFMAMPSARNRILGVQLYKFQIKGFLHWGFNFYYSQQSVHAIDPYRVTDGMYWVPAGDTFVVYPGKEGPLPSLRLFVLREALQDLRALELLEKAAGRAEVMSILEADLASPITFKDYPTTAEWLLRIRQTVNERLKRLYPASEN